MHRGGGSLSHSKHRSGQFGKHNFRPDRRRLHERVREWEEAERAAKARRVVGVEWFASIAEAMKRGGK